MCKQHVETKQLTLAEDMYVTPSGCQDTDECMPLLGGLLTWHSYAASANPGVIQQIMCRHLPLRAPVHDRFIEEKYIS
jgi:hypothetical protein